MAAAVGGFDEVAQQQLRDEIQVQLEKCHGEPPREVYPVQYTLMKEGNMSAPHHVWIGPSQWTHRPEVEVLNRVHEKHACLKWLLHDEGNNNNNGLLLELIRGVNEELGNTSNNHGCEGLQRKELVKRMLLDGCYIIYKFAKCPPINPSPGLQGNHHGLLHMMLVGPCCRLMDRIRGVHNARESAAAGGAANNSSSNIDVESGVEMQPVGESAQAAGGGAAAAADERRQQPHTALAQPVCALARWLECRDTWCLMNNCVPYGVLDVINHLVYGAPEGGFGGATARILLHWWSMYCYVPPSPNPVHIVPRNTVQAGDANCLLILLSQLLKPPQRDSSLLNSTCRRLAPGQQEEQQHQHQHQQLLCGWRRATEYVRRCNARFVASPLDATERRLCVLDVTATVRGCFRSIDVQVPPLLIDGITLALLRNLVALEQRGITAHRYVVTAYCIFMRMIASQPEDVELLQREGIIYHFYSDPMDVATGFKEVVQIAHVGDADSYLLPIQQELGRRYNKSTVHRCLSWFRVSYCYWTKADVLALFTALFAVPAIVYAALSYYHQAAAAVVPHPGGRH